MPQHLTHRVNAPDLDTHTPEITTQHIEINVLTATAQAISLPYACSPAFSSPELLRKAEDDPILAQRGAWGQPANSGKVDQVAEANKPTIVAAEACL